MKTALTLTVVLCLTGLQALASPFTNLDTLRASLGFQNYDNQPTRGAAVKVAVFDNGFEGYQNEIGRTLPGSTTYHAGPVAPPEPQERHGLVMAQILNHLLTDGGRRLEAEPELHLYPTFGYSNLEAAVNDAIARGIEVILYSQVWEYGGNSDGRGFINALVSRATSAGILWINAAGNFGDSTFESNIIKTSDNWALLPDPNNSVWVRCKAPTGRTCHLRAVLSWNDFKDDVNLGSDKDLDLQLNDDTMKQIQIAALTQSSQASGDQPGFSKYPREILQAEVAPGLYQMRVKISSDGFQSTDRMRLTVSGDFLEMLSATKDETLLNPADHPDVIAVGASDSEKSASSRALAKPELETPSLIQLQNGESYKGTSNSAAIVAAGAVVLKGQDRRLNRHSFLRLTAQSRNSAPGSALGNGLTLEQLQFAPTGAGCFVPVTFPQVPSYLEPFLRDGGRPVQTTAGVKVFFDFDPMNLIRGLARIRPNDVVTVAPLGIAVFPREHQRQLPRGSYEVVQKPWGQTYCDEAPTQPSDSNARPFRLPAPGWSL